MLKYIKNLFGQEKKREEKISLDNLNQWLNERAKPISDRLKNEWDYIATAIKDEKEVVFVD